MSNEEIVLKILQDSEALPFLFVGSGISKRYLGADSWENLLRSFAQKCDSSPYYFEKLREQAKSDLTSKGLSADPVSILYPKIADLIEIEFSKIWYDSEVYAESRTIHSKEIHRGISPFKIELSEYCKNLIARKPDLEDEVALFKELSDRSIAGIITTNYDCFLDEIFPDFVPYIGQEELVFSDHQAINEIYKIHGCCNIPESIVINSKDYEEFNKKNAYLAAKLLTIFVEHPIIFLGYSLQDDNINKILQAIIDCLGKDNLEKLKNRLIFVVWDTSKEELDLSTYSRDFGNGKSLDMTRISLSNYGDFYKLLLKIKARYPTKWMRQIKKDIYELTLTTSPHAKLALLNTDAAVGQQIEYVVGFGVLEIARNGYKGTKVETLYWDVIFDNKNLIPELVVECTIVDLLPTCKIHIPAFKYLASYDKKIPDYCSKFLSEKFEDFSTREIRRIRAIHPYHSIREVYEGNHGNLYKTLLNIAALPQDEIELDSLLSFLKELLLSRPNILSEENTSRSLVKKLILMYDWLKYKK